MQEFSYTKALGNAFFSEALYRDVVRTWKGLGLRYLLLLTAITVSVMALLLLRGFLFASTESLEKFAQEVPQMDLSGGELTFHGPQPYHWTFPGELSPRIIIDTGGSISSLEGSPAEVLITKSGIHVRRQNGATKFTPFTPDLEFKVTPENVVQWLKTLRWICLAFIPLLILLAFLINTVVSIIYTFAALLLQGMFGLSLPFETLLRLCIVSATPKELFYLICTLLGLQIPYPMLLGMGLSLMYLIFALRANVNREQSRPVASA